MMKRIVAAGLFLALSCLGASASTCNVSEFYLTADAGVQVARVPSLVDQATITVTGTTAQSAAFSADTKLARVWCDTQSAVVFGPNPSATTAGLPLSAGQPEYFQVIGGQKAAFILRP